MQLGEHCRRTIGLISGAIAQEVRMFWDFTWRDWSAGLIPGTIYTVAALRSLESVSMELVIQSLIRSLAYFLLYIYTFNLANQINGLDEDRVNKPDRPICSGRVDKWLNIVISGSFRTLVHTRIGSELIGSVWSIVPSVWTT
ncbi:hypothetical protein K438DRAFT_1794455 [Mycena galopus ATCC 62051]|nr:hypothetical protein K438DRAFT_1794455 [Mycena galopus ATCC 62051]